MPVRIQLRRGTANEWNSNSGVVLALGEIGLEHNTGKFKIGDGTTSWASLPYRSLPDNVVPQSAYTAKGVLLGASAAGAPVAVTAGANNSVLVADSAQTAGLKWATTLSGLTLTSPTITGPTITGNASITTITSGTTIASPTVTSPTITGGTATSTTLVTPVITAPLETWSVSATAATGTVNVNVKTATNWYYTSNTSANWTFNFRGDGGTTLNSMLSVGQSVTVGFVVTNGATAYIPTAFQVDGSAQTVRWQGNVAPAAGNPNNLDAYVFTIVKTAATPTYTVFGAQTKFA